jgi:hypothetical protein
MNSSVALDLRRSFQDCVRDAARRGGACPGLLAAAGHQAVRLMDQRGGWSITSPGLGDYGNVACSRTYVYACALRLYRAVAQRQAIEGV